MIEKSRDIALSDLYSCLQLEFLSYFLRSKTYCRDFSTRYREVCKIKRDKIEKISLRNSLPSIFNDEKTKQRYLVRFFNETGVPNFTYKNDLIKDKMSCWDRFYYFQKGASVKFTDNNEVLIGQVTQNNKNYSIVSLIDENKKIHELHYNTITRIFSDNYFDFSELSTNI